MQLTNIALERFPKSASIRNIQTYGTSTGSIVFDWQDLVVRIDGSLEVTVAGDRRMSDQAARIIGLILTELIKYRAD